jgi:Lon protease-like protein
VPEIGLFPLGIVLLPGERVPLHIFEPRYRELIGECIAEERPFGLLLDDDQGMRDVGTTAAVVEVLERFDDGRVNIVVEGRDRFRVLQETAGRSFRTAEISPLPDGGEQPDEAELDRCLAAYRRLVEAAGAEHEDPDPGVEGRAYWIAARVDFGLDVKQELLELRSEQERIGRLTPLLEQARAAVRFATTARDRATGNGRVEPPERSEGGSAGEDT